MRYPVSGIDPAVAAERQGMITGGLDLDPQASRSSRPDKRNKPAAIIYAHAGGLRRLPGLTPRSGRIAPSSARGSRQSAEVLFFALSCGQAIDVGLAAWDRRASIAFFTVAEAVLGKIRAGLWTIGPADQFSR